MLYELKGICQVCGRDYKLVIPDKKKIDSCDNCGNPPLEFKNFQGVIYIISHPNQIGVKVGLTTNDIDKRVQQLESTGVPGKFNKVAIFPSSRPKQDEKKAHQALKKCYLAKEHFQITPTEAVLKVHKALNYRIPIFFDNQIEQEFNEEKEKRRTLMQSRLKGK